MRVEYSKRSIADLRKIADYHLRSNDLEIAAALEQRIRATIVRRPWEGTAINII